MKVDIFSPNPDDQVAKIGSVNTSDSDLTIALTGNQIAVGGILFGGIVAKKGKAFQGYAKQSDLEQITTETVSIPANFAGLEAVMVPTRLEEQLFRVVEVHEGKDYVTITARHVWYDNLSNQTWWKADPETRYSAGAVCRNVLQSTVSPVPSRVATDCTDEIIGKDLDYERKNLVEAFLDPENGICAKFGLSMIRNNWDFYCLKDVGYNRGIVIQNKKNLLGVERKESIENVITRIAPIGKDENGDIIWMNFSDNWYVDSGHIVDYAFPRSEIYDTGLQIGKDDVTAENIQGKLFDAANKRFSEDKVDIPEVEMTIEFISLGDTEEYAQYRDLDKVYLYDILTIIDTERGYSYTAQVVAVEHHLLTGMLNSVTIGKLDNWDGKRKIATWQVPEIDGANIRLKSIMAGSFEPGAIFAADIANGQVTVDHLAAHTITADKIAAHTITAAEIAAGTITATEIAAATITADKINAESLAAAFADVNVLNSAIATIAEAEIGSADIGFAQIKALTTESLIAHDAVTDRYFIDKLAVRSAQMVQATVGELIIKATDNHYYRLDVNAQGALSPTDVTSSLSNSEITAGVTSDGHSAIIETDLTVADLSASNMKAINALIDKLTAARIDVDELFARQATITQLNTVDIRGNQYLQLMVTGYGTTYTQWTDPASEQGNTVKNGDVWYKGFPLTWAQMENYTWAQLESYTYAGLEGYVQYLRKGGVWVEVNDPMEVQYSVAMIGIENDKIALRVEDTWNGLARIGIETSRISAIVEDNTGNIAALIVSVNGIEQRVMNVEDGKISKTTTLQTADAIVTEAVSQAASAVAASYIAKTTVLQTADAIVLEAEKTSAINIVPAFSTSAAYAVGAFVSYNGKVYKFTSAHSAGAWNASQVAESNVTEYVAANAYSIKSGITIASEGVAVSGNKYIKLDVNANNYIHMDQNGLDIMGNRIKVNGKYVFDRSDIIIMNPNSTEAWRRTVAGIEGQMSGKHDWVLIRPYYDAKISYNYLGDYSAQASSVGSTPRQLSQESGIGNSFGTSTSYRYVFHCTVPIQQTISLGITLKLCDTQNMVGNVVTSTQTATVSTTEPTNIEFSITSPINFCTENSAIWFKLECDGRNVGGISNISLDCYCDATVSRVPCTTYYYP